MGLFQVVCLGLMAAVGRTQETRNCSADTTLTTIRSTEDAAALATSLECANGDLTVLWDGEVLVDQTIRVNNATSLNITGAGPDATAHGDDITQLFVVNGGSRLYLAGMTLAHGNTSADGGAIYAESSSVSLGGNTSFVSSSAGGNGGAMFAFDSTISWDGDAIMFRDNHADINGGAIYALDSSVSWNGDGTAFSNNNADECGGAMYLESSTLTWHGDGAELSNNHANVGGAMYVEVSTVSGNGDGAEFSNNHADTFGGAMYMEVSAVSWDGDGVEISNNYADVYGGAMYLEGSSVSWDGDGAELSNNFARYDGGAMYLMDSSVSWDGDGAELSNNSAGIYGGAMNLMNSNVSWEGDGSVFSNNTAAVEGGAMHVSDSHVSWDGDGIVFSDNYGGYGGALSLYGSTVSWIGDGAEFTSNSAETEGGAMDLYESTISWDGDGAEFSNNSAGVFGGAINLKYSTAVSWDGSDAEFSNNFAEVDGGAMHLTSSTISWDGNGTEFTNNYADANGGAIELRYSELSWAGEGTNFVNNHAGTGFGGAIYSADTSAVSWGGATSFITNSAGSGGGAVALVDFGSESPVVTDATFIENSSGTGGALYVYNSGQGSVFTDVRFQGNSASGAGGAFAVYAGTARQPATFTRCSFSNNTAIGAGGAVETFSGWQEFYSCNFEGNSADVGGALTLGGETSVRDSSFRSNSASTRGLAVDVAGSVNISDSLFDGNELFCALGSYRKDDEEGANTARFDAVCLNCPSWDECSGCSITRGNVTPTCVATLDHTSAEEPGATLETLNVTQGYWRATTKSDNVLACFNLNACNGGQTGAEGYCTPGYYGPYCAVCEADYAPSLGHTCTRCSSSRRQGLIAATAIAALAALFAVVMVCNFLLSTELEDRNIRWFRRRVLRAVPVQSLKIVVVVWQILTQFADAASITYPGVYQDFLSAIDIVNFDIGSVLAAGCMWSGIDFHDRLLLSTLGPLTIAGFLAATYRIAMRRKGAADNAAAAEKIRHKHQTALLLLTFLVYSSVSSMIFQTFACETLDDGIEYLRADYSIHCTDARHVAFEVYAGIMILVYPVGIPLLYAILLYQHRDVLSDASADKTAAQSISSLWEPYRPERFCYEVVECGRRIMLTGVVVFIFPNDAAQIAITILIALFFSAVFDVLSPYKSESDMWLSRGGHVIVFLSMFDMLLLKVDVSSESDESQAVFAGVLVAGHVLMLLAIVIEVIGICFASRKKVVVEGVGSSPSRPAESKPRAESEDDVPVFQSVPASWRSFMRQCSVSEASGPTRSGSGTVLAVCRPESC